MQNYDWRAHRVELGELLAAEDLVAGLQVGLVHLRAEIRGAAVRLRAPARVANTWAVKKAHCQATLPSLDHARIRLAGLQAALHT